jgi:nicotinamidase-related amidase
MAQNETSTKEALLIIDIQEFYFVDGKSQLVNPEVASEKAALLLEQYRNKNKLVVHIQHASSKNASIHENVQPKDNEKVITKNFVNSYRETDLLDFLKRHKITDVVICGMMTHVCVEAAARASADHGFNVTVISDACTTRNVTYDADTVQSNGVHQSTLATIRDFYGTVMTSEEYLKKIN